MSTNFVLKAIFYNSPISGTNVLFSGDKYFTVSFWKEVQYSTFLGHIRFMSFQCIETNKMNISRSYFHILCQLCHISGCIFNFEISKSTFLVISTQSIFAWNKIESEILDFLISSFFIETNVCYLRYRIHKLFRFWNYIMLRSVEDYFPDFFQSHDKRSSFFWSMFDLKSTFLSVLYSVLGLCRARCFRDIMCGAIFRVQHISFKTILIGAIYFKGALLLIS